MRRCAACDATFVAADRSETACSESCRATLRRRGTYHEPRPRVARTRGYVSPLWPPAGDPRAAHGQHCPRTCPCRPQLSVVREENP